MKRESWMLNPPDALSIFSENNESKRSNRKKPIDLAKEPSTGTQTSCKTVNDGGMEWHSRRIERLYEQSKRENRSIREVVEDNYGSYEEFKLLEDQVKKYQTGSTAAEVNYDKKWFGNKNYKDQRQGPSRNKSNQPSRTCIEDNEHETAFHTKLAFKSKQHQNQDDKSDFSAEVQDPDRQTKRSKRKTIEEYQSTKECAICNEYTDPSELVISASANALIMLPNRDFISAANHLLLSTRDHIPSSLQADTGTKDELRNYKKCIIRYNAKRNKGTIFIEFYDSTRKWKHAQEKHHCLIEAFGIPADMLDSCRSIIKNTLLDNLGEWSGLKLIETNSKKKIDTAIPKEFGFVHVTVGLDDGFVHVIDSEAAELSENVEESIENSLMHSKHVHERFGKELAASILNVEAWRNCYPSLLDIQRIKREFAEFDWISMSPE